MIFRSWIVLIRIGAWIFNCYLNWYFILRTIWVCYDYCCVFITFCCCVNWCLVLEGCATWKIGNITDRVLGIWCVAWFNSLILSSRCVLVRICAWIFNCYFNWNFIFRSIWVCYDNCCVFVTCCCCIYWCLIFKCSTTWKVGNVTDWVLGIWCVTDINRLILSYRSIYISLSWICGYSNLNWYFILRTVWVSNNNCCVFVTCSCCIYWCLVFKCSTTWKVGNVTDRVLGIWCVAKVNRLILSYRCILICICAWIYNRYLNWDFILRTIWISYNNCCILLTSCCCINWGLILEGSTAWKVWNVADWTFGIRCVANVNGLILSSWCVLVCICSWILNGYFNWNFVLRTIWVSYDYCCVFFTCSCCIWLTNRLRFWIRQPANRLH